MRTNSTKERHLLCTQGVVLPTLIAIIAVAITIDTAAAQQTSAAVVVQDDGFHDACFITKIAGLQKRFSTTTVRLAIEYEQSSGNCGCKSAALKIKFTNRNLALGFASYRQA